jgi:hypothetical protein
MLYGKSSARRIAATVVIRVWPIAHIVLQAGITYAIIWAVTVLPSSFASSLVDDQTRFSRV